MRGVPIPIYGRGGTVRAYTFVDMDDAVMISRRRWHLDSDGYAIRHVLRDDGLRTTVALHRVLLGLRTGDGLEADHRDRNRLNNTRENLRALDHASQMQNVSGRGRSPLRGVTWHRQAGKWQARIVVDRRRHSLGLFDSQEEAARVAASARAQLMPYSAEAAESAR